jgi:hypothetical protein
MVSSLLPGTTPFATYAKLRAAFVTAGPSTFLFRTATNTVSALRSLKLRAQKTLVRESAPPCSSLIGVSADVDTARWPVGSANTNLLVETAKTHDARVFPLFNRADQPVPALDAQKVLPGVLVEVSFRMIHYGFSRDGNTIDSMTGKTKVNVGSQAHST